jgi:hypothetical protein
MAMMRSVAAIVLKRDGRVLDDQDFVTPLSQDSVHRLPARSIDEGAVDQTIETLVALEGMPVSRPAPRSVMNVYFSKASLLVGGRSNATP